VLKLLEEVDASRRNLEPLIERINKENEDVEEEKRRYNALKFSYSELLVDSLMFKFINFKHRKKRINRKR